jgi:competence protein CoiA
VLTAKLESGEVISLGENHSREDLKKLRSKEKFYCRSCSEKVILKLGIKRIFHFAHEPGSTCAEEYERESEYHMSGKLKLYQWLISQGIPAELERYFPSIQQRADIAFQYEGNTYCLEYQCSTISEELLRKRTEGYRQLSLIPIWILGGKNIVRKNHKKASISNFQFLFLKENGSHQSFIPSYCPHIDQFILLENIIPLSTRIAYCSFSLNNLTNMSMSEVLEPPISKMQYIDEWENDIKRFKQRYLTNSPSIKEPFLFELYSRSLNPYFLPPYVGLPLKQSYVMETPPFIWQTYLFLDHFYREKEGTILHFHEVYIKFLRKVKSGQLSVRGLPNITRNTLPFVVSEYLSLLDKAGVLKKVKINTYVIDKPVRIANNMEEQAREEEMFYKKLRKSINS